MSDNRIHVWLKVFHKPEKEALESVFRHLAFWMRTFQDREKYRITIYSENVELPRQYYPEVEIVDRKSLIEGSQTVAWLAGQIQASKIIDPIWKSAAFALLAPYFYSESKYLWNIDASDLIWPGKTEENLDRAFEVLKQHQLPVLSSDIYLSVPNFSWSFGICLTDVEKFREIVKVVLPRKVPVPGWKTNIDHMMSCYLLNGHHNYPYVSFTSGNWFEHEGPIGKGLCSRWEKERKMCVCDLYGREKRYGRLNQKSLLLG